MKKIPLLLLAVALAPAAFAATRSVPSQYSTINAAINATASGDTVSIAAGNYNEAVVVPSSKTNLTITGAGKTTTRIYVGANSDAMQVLGSNILVKNLTLENTAGAAGAQQQALYTVGKQLSFNNCLIKGWQDTLQMKQGSQQYFYKCEIWGSVDFIYDGGTAFIDQCTIKEVRDVGGPVCAPATPAGVRGIIFSSCYITRASSVVANASSTLCRVWKSPGECAYINCSMDHLISAKGWLEWSGHELDSRCAEYGSTWHADGSTIDLSQRASWVVRLSSAANYTKSAILGSWNPRL
jgi:pectinesterase